MKLKVTFMFKIYAFIKLGFFKKNDDSIFVVLINYRGKFFVKDYFYEKEKGTLNKVSFFMKLILKIKRTHFVDFV